MTVKSILDEKGTDVRSIEGDRLLMDAIKLLDKGGVGALVVSFSDKPLAGILSERDIVRALCHHGAGVLEEEISKYMTKEIITISPEKSVRDAIEIMTQRRIRHLPVTQDERMIGIISIGDVLKRRISSTEAEAEALKNYISTG